SGRQGEREEGRGAIVGTLLQFCRRGNVERLAPAPCSTPPSYALPGTFAPRPGLIHLATPLRPGELKALFITENLVVLYSDLVELTCYIAMFL
ncbi:Mitochondrial distribution and morphology protein 10, partial [Dissostichus eleginoides]